MNTKANIFDIKRFGTNDGSGIRTVVFIKGCPLRCRWCQNPEGLLNEIGIWHVKSDCAACGACKAACEYNAISQNGRDVRVDKQACTMCGACVYACPTGALRMDGTRMRVADVMKEIEKDRVFYCSEGGVTLSGGECTASPAFSLALLRACRAAGIHTAIETCMYAPSHVMEEFAHAADLILADIKLFDAKRHKAATGVDNALILRNFKMLAHKANEIIVRIPLIPGFTADEENIAAIAQFVAGVNADIPIELLNFNPLCEGKYEALGQEYITMGGKPFSNQDMERFCEAARVFGLRVDYEGRRA